MDPVTPQAVVVAAGCLVACYTDLRWGMIYNWLTLPMIVLGLVMNTSLGLWQLAAWGLVLGFAVHWGLWRLGIQRGGDAKLMIGVSALLGTQFMAESTLWYGLIYIPAGLGMLVFSGRLKNLVDLAKHQMAAQAGGPKPEAEAPQPTMMKTAPVIAVAVLLAFATPWIDGLLVTATTGEVAVTSD